LESASASSVPLPSFSERVRQQLDNGDITADMDRFIEECAYHIIANGDMKDRGLYEEFGRKLYYAYPCIEHPGNQPWVCCLD